MNTVSHCRFRTSYGGALFCQDSVYLEGFCKFHFHALQQGEIFREIQLTS